MGPHRLRRLRWAADPHRPAARPLRRPERWIGPTEFQDAIGACNLLPGPASTQLAILCAWKVAGPAGAAVGGVAFIVPGLVAILALAAVLLAASPPTWVLAAGAGSGAAVAAVAIDAGSALVPASWAQARSRGRWIAYVLAGGVSAATVGPWLVVVLLGCAGPAALVAAASTSTGGVLALAWVALKVGALAYGGGFVIVPLMQHHAVDRYRWMTDSQFLDAVALGQITPGPVVQTVAAVGYAAAGLACARRGGRRRRRRARRTAAVTAGGHTWRMEQALARSAFMVGTGLTLGEVSATRVKGTLALGPDQHTPWGAVHGGGPRPARAAPRHRRAAAAEPGAAARRLTRAATGYPIMGKPQRRR